jgi:hypothetical protein
MVITSKTRSVRAASFGRRCERQLRWRSEPVRAESRDVLLTRTPHSGFHIEGRGDCMEGWYVRVCSLSVLLHARPGKEARCKLSVLGSVCMLLYVALGYRTVT